MDENRTLNDGFGTSVPENTHDSREAEALALQSAPSDVPGPCDRACAVVGEAEDGQAAVTEQAPDSVAISDVEGESGKIADEPSSVIASAEEPERGKRRKGRQYIFTPKDRLICVIASGVAALASLIFVYLLTASFSGMSDAVKRMEDANAAERIIAMLAHLLIVFGVGSGSMTLSAISYGFAKSAHKGCEGNLRHVALGLRILRLPVVLASLSMMASAAVLFFRAAVHVI